MWGAIQGWIHVLSLLEFSQYHVEPSPSSKAPPHEHYMKLESKIVFHFLTFKGRHTDCDGFGVVGFFSGRL